MKKYFLFIMIMTPFVGLAKSAPRFCRDFCASDSNADAHLDEYAKAAEKKETELQRCFKECPMDFLIKSGYLKKVYTLVHEKKHDIEKTLTPLSQEKLSDKELQKDLKDKTKKIKERAKKKAAEEKTKKEQKEKEEKWEKKMADKRAGKKPKKKKKDAKTKIKEMQMKAMQNMIAMRRKMWGY